MSRPWVSSLLIVILLSGMASSRSFGQMPKGKELDREREEVLRDFATRVRRIAIQYEQAGDHEKAKNTLRLLLQSAPNDVEAKALLDRISRQELAANKTTVKIFANQGWQSAGVQVQEGKPVVIETKGTWVLRMNRVVGADGLEVPYDMRDFPLGSLIGAIDPAAGSVPEPRAETADRRALLDAIRETAPAAPRDSPAAAKGKKPTELNPRPFLIGSKKVLTPAVTGTLYLKVHDSIEADNSGELIVTISGQVRQLAGSAGHLAKSQKQNP